MVNSCGFASILATTVCLFASESLAAITQFKEVDGFKYATLGNADVDGTDYTGCENTTFLQMPNGWELVPWADHAKVRDDVVSASGFDTTGLALENGGIVIGKGGDPNPNPDFPKGKVDASMDVIEKQGNDNYKVKFCPVRILIRQQVQQPTNQPTNQPTVDTTTMTTTTLNATVTKKKTAITSKGFHAVFGWSTAIMLFMFWASAP